MRTTGKILSPIGPSVSALLSPQNGMFGAIDVPRAALVGRTRSEYNGVMTDLVTDWMNKYIAAWKSNDPGDIRALFTEDAVYATRPNDPSPWRGHDEIVERWIAAGDQPDNWTFEWSLLGIDSRNASSSSADAGTAFVQGLTHYLTGSPSYDNLWVITLTADGRASAFTEWYMEREAPESK